MVRKGTYGFGVSSCILRNGEAEPCNKSQILGDKLFHVLSCIKLNRIHLLQLFMMCFSYIPHILNKHVWMRWWWCVHSTICTVQCGNRQYNGNWKNLCYFTGLWTI